jgi:hypothetical protein
MRPIISSFLLTSFMFGSFTSASAQQVGDQASWLIVPGRSYGPIEIGMAEMEVERTIGRPLRGYAIGAARWEYNGFSLIFPPNRRVLYIHIWYNGAATREGTKIGGSIINDVVRTYGDSEGNRFIPPTNSASKPSDYLPRDCLNLRIAHGASSLSYAHLALYLDYLNHGISFWFTPVGPTEAVPYVESVSIAAQVAQTQCRRI